MAKNKELKNTPQETKPTAPETKPATADDDSGQDVTVTSIKPSDNNPSSSKPAGSSSSDVQIADAGKAVPIRGHGKDKDKDKERVVPQTPGGNRQSYHAENHCR